MLESATWSNSSKILKNRDSCVNHNIFIRLLAINFDFKRLVELSSIAILSVYTEDLFCYISDILPIMLGVAAAITVACAVLVNLTFVPTMVMLFPKYFARATSRYEQLHINFDRIFSFFCCYCFLGGYSL